MVFQKKIKVEWLDKVEELSKDPAMQFINEAWTLAVTRNKVAERRKFIIDLSLMWISATTILKQVNKLTPVKWWWTVANETAIQNTISNEFKDYQNSNSWELEEHLEGLKQNAFAKQEYLIEKASLHISEKNKNWKPFEYIAAIKETFLMNQQMIENKNWNDSKKNINAISNNTTNQLNIFVDNSKKIAFWQVENPVLNNLLSMLESKFQQKNLTTNED